MANLSDGFKDIFLAGIGAMAMTGEKTKEVVDQLIAKGEMTVDQGKQINSELKHKAEDAVNTVRYDALEARMAVMTPEEREAFAAKAAEIAQRANAKVGDATDTVAQPNEPLEVAPESVESVEPVEPAGEAQAAQDAEAEQAAPAAQAQADSDQADA